MAKPFTLYKLIILYMLNEVDYPLTNSQISEFLLEKEYTNYFHLQQTFSELVDSNLLEVKTVRNASYYRLTEAGRTTLSYFGKEISDTIKEEIQNFLKEKGCEIKDSTSVSADYYKSTNQDYHVRCQLKERGADMLDLTLAVPTKEAAEAICRQWSQKHLEINEHLMETLLN